MNTLLKRPLLHFVKPLHFKCVKYCSKALINVFDKRCKDLQRKRAYEADDVETFDYLKDEVGSRLMERLLDVNRKFDRAVDLGCGRGHVCRHMTSDCVATLHLCDRVPSVLDQCALPRDEQVTVVKQVLSDDDKLPFDDSTIDAFVSNLYLHWVNDLPAIFSDIMRCLKSDGAFLGVMFGGDTLYELRCSLQVVETERLGGVAAHVSPFIQISDVGRLLNQAGFTLLTIDTDEIVVAYPSMFELMWDLKGMGENNAAWRRCSHLNRQVLAAASAVYQTMYGSEPNRIPATFQLVYFIGWKPDASQPRPAPRGSQSHSFQQLQHLVTAPNRES